MAEMDDVIEAPLKIAANLDKVVESIERIIKKSQEQGDAIKQANSISETKKLIAALGTETEQLKKVNSELQTQIANMKRAGSATNKHADAVDALDSNTGGFISRLKEMGRQFAILARSPFVLFLTGLVATFTALTSAVKLYYTTTAEGEDVLDRQRAVWDIFFSSLRRGWANVGKDVDDSVGPTFLKNMMANFIAFFSVPAAMEFKRLSGQAEELADRLNDLNDSVNANRIKSAKNQVELNELLIKSQDAVNFSEQQRVAFIDQYIAKKKDQNALDISIAKEQEKNTIIAIGLQRGLSEATSTRLFETGKMSEE